MRLLLVIFGACLLFAYAAAQVSVHEREIMPIYDVENECVRAGHPCGRNSECVIGPMGPTCECLYGYEGNGHICRDINECTFGLYPCDSNAECFNSDGSYACICKDGFEGDGKICSEFFSEGGGFPPIQDEEQSTEPAGIFLELRGGDKVIVHQRQARTWIDPGWKVSRSGGGYTEADVYYDLPEEMLQGIVGTYIIPYHATDHTGQRAAPVSRTVEVIDVDECALKEDSCSVHAVCHNTVGGYTCECKPGFTGDGFKCTDIDECKLGTHNCDIHARCENTQGSYFCVCEDGYEGDGKTCVDIDECRRGTHNCDPHAYCANTDGGYNCTCASGYEGNGFVCRPIDSCEHGTHDCSANAVCTKTDTYPGYRCTCMKGFAGDGRTCVDVDECALGTYDCPSHSHCVNTEGGYQCYCDQGFEKALDGYACVDINECAKEIDDCSTHATCYNTEGGYDCVCNEGYEGNGRVCNVIASPTDIILRGANPLFMKQCESYREESFMLVDPKKEKLRVTITMPPALMEDNVMIAGTHQVFYHVTDQGHIKSTVVRNVTVERINACELPEGHPCRHKCHPYANCFPDDYTGYRCECTEGFDTIIVNNTTICKDNVPPTIVLTPGTENVILTACRMCKWYDPGETYDEKKHGGFIAYDPLPDGNRIDLSDRVVVTNETVIPDREWRLHYNVADWAGNRASTVVRVVHKEVEDVLRRIENVENFLHQKFAEFDPYPKKIDMFTAAAAWVLRVIGLILGLLFILYLLPRIKNLVKAAFFSTKPSFEDFTDGYELWYGITKPWESAAARKRRVAIDYQRKYNDRD